jgi:hypothetical protein
MEKIIYVRTGDALWDAWDTASLLYANYTATRKIDAIERCTSPPF